MTSDELRASVAVAIRNEPAPQCAFCGERPATTEERGRPVCQPCADLAEDLEGAAEWELRDFDFSNLTVN